MNNLSNLPPGVTNAMIDAQTAEWPEFDEFVNWLATRGMPSGLSFHQMKNLWARVVALEPPKGVEIEERIIEAIRSRRDIGRRKYGMSMERTDLNYGQWLTHAQEEAMDLIIYLEKLKRDFGDGLCLAVLSHAQAEELRKTARWQQSDVLRLLEPYRKEGETCIECAKRVLPPLEEKQPG